MNPKNKGKELYDKFLSIVKQSDLDDTCSNKAKKCAMIVCDEQLNLANLMDGGFSFEDEINYWKKVKLEISSLDESI